GHPEERLPNTLNVGFRGRIGVELLATCPTICASTGSACHSGKQHRSSVLAAMGVADDVAFGAVRFSVGRSTTEAEIDEAIQAITTPVESILPSARLHGHTPG
ncbi:MAG: cysteine desulfurase NifS, partial [Planctomycetota bacterium]